MKKSFGTVIGTREFSMGQVFGHDRIQSNMAKKSKKSKKNMIVKIVLFLFGVVAFAVALEMGMRAEDARIDTINQRHSERMGR